MKSRIVAGVFAAVCGVLGLLLVLIYASKADDRAMASLDPVQVLVVQQPVPAGTPADQVGEYLAVETLPANSVADTAISDLNGKAGTVTSTNLLPGEQLLAERLIAPEQIKSSGSVKVPKGLQEVSFQLEPQRVLGGRLVAGDHVGVFISMDKGGSEASPEKETTQLVVRKALLTAIQRAPQPVTEGGETDTQALPEGSMLVTVAVDDKAAQKIVFAAEFAKIWLSKEPEDAKESKPTVVQRSEVYE